MQSVNLARQSPGSSSPARATSPLVQTASSPAHYVSSSEDSDFSREDCDPSPTKSVSTSTHSVSTPTKPIFSSTHALLSPSQAVLQSNISLPGEEDDVVGVFCTSSWSLLPCLFSHHCMLLTHVLCMCNHMHCLGALSFFMVRSH